MATSNYHSLVESGGGNVEYCFQVSGYPWAICTSPACADAINASTTYLRRIFGYANFSRDGSKYPADNCKVFPTLDMKSLGRQRWSIDEKKGGIRGGSWAVSLSDVDLGYDWPYRATGDTIRGLDGVHRVANVRDSAVHGWGHIEENLLRSQADFDIAEQSSSLIFDRIAALGAAEYLILWIGHEAIAVTAKTGTWPEYNLTIPGSTGRGLFRSREQDHFTSFFSGTNPLIADNPGSIVGHYCWLWAVPMDGASILATPTLERCGTVSDKVETRKSRTVIGINSPIDSLKSDLPTPKQMPQGKLAKFVLSRGKYSGTESRTLFPYRQAPHLVIREWLEGSSKFVAKAIWLCALDATNGSSVTFNTYEEILEALETELAYCTADNAGQVSGDDVIDGNDLVDLVYSYHIIDGRIYQNETDPDKLSYLSGPLAWLLGLADKTVGTGGGTFGGHSMGRVWALADGYADYDFVNSMFVENTKNGTAFTGDDFLYHTGIWLKVPESPLASAQSSRAEYILQYDWQSSTLPEAVHEWDTALGGNLQCGETIPWLVGGAIGAKRLWLSAETDVDSFVASDPVYVGNRLYGGSISESGTVGDYNYLEMTSGTLSTLSDMDDFPAGASLFYLTGIFNSTPKDTYHLNQGYAKIKSDTLSDMLRALLGETISGIAIPEWTVISSVPFFTDITIDGDKEFESLIDWDSMDECFTPIAPGHYYYLPLDSDVNIHDILSSETLFHGCNMTHEWDSTDSMDKIKFRRVGLLNGTYAYNAGRVINATNRDDRAQLRETHNDKWLCNKLSVESNYDGEEYFFNAVIDSPGAFAVANRGTNVVKIESKISQIPILEVEVFNDIALKHIYTYFADGLLRHMSEPAHTQSSMATMAARFKLAMGREALLTDTAARVPYTHELGLEDHAILVVSKSVDLARQRITFSYRIGGPVGYGFAPACRVLSGNTTKVDGSEMYVTPVSHEFTPTSDREDMYYFDCFTVDQASGELTARSCNCGNYSVIGFEQGSFDPTLMEYTCSVDQDNGRLYLYGTNTSWATTGADYILIFASWDDCEVCQQKYIFGAGSDNTLGTGSDKGFRWV